MTRSCPPRNIVILVYPGVQSLDVTGPLEVFSGAQQLLEAGPRRPPDGQPLAEATPD